MNRKLLIIVPISKSYAFKEIIKSFSQRAKSGIRCFLEKNISQLSGSLLLTDYHFRTTNHSNRGDIAIGESSVQAVSQLGFDVDVIGWDDLSVAKTEWINSNFDAVVLGGGGYIFLDSSGRLNHRIRDLLILEKISKPIISYGIGLNRLMHEESYKTSNFDRLPTETKDYLTRFCDCLNLIGVRDKDTQTLLQPYFNKEVFLIGDPVLFYKQEKDAAFLVKNNSIGVNCAAHGWRAVSVLKKVMPIFENFLGCLTENNELNYFVHENLEYPVYDYLRGRGISLSKIDGPTDHLLEHYSECRFVVNQMLHSSIFAFNKNTPSINIAYDLKSVAFFELFGLQECCIPWNYVTERSLMDAAKNVDENRDEISELIKNGKVKLLRTRDDYFSEFVRIF